MYPILSIWFRVLFSIYALTCELFLFKLGNVLFKIVKTIYATIKGIAPNVTALFNFGFAAFTDTATAIATSNDTTYSNVNDVLSDIIYNN